MYAYNSYIPQTEQHEPEGQMLFCLGNVINLLDVTPSNPMPHPLHLHSFHFVLFKVKDVVAKQHPKTYIQIYFSFPYFPPMSFLTPSHSPLPLFPPLSLSFIPILPLSLSSPSPPLPTHTHFSPHFLFPNPSPKSECNTTWLPYL